MVNYEYHNYEDSGYDLSNAIVNTHLIWEVDDDYFYFATTGKLKIYLKQVSTGIETEIDVDPSNTSGDVKSRDHEIQSAFHDRTNKIIYFIDLETFSVANSFDVWKLDYSSSKSEPSVTEIVTYSGSYIQAVDIFIYDDSVKVRAIEASDGGAFPANGEDDLTITLYTITTGATRNLQLNIANNDATNVISSYPGIVKTIYINDFGKDIHYTFLFWGAVGGYPSNTFYLWGFDLIPAYGWGIAHIETVVDGSAPSEELRFIAHDDADLIYFPVDEDGTNYLWKYSIDADDVEQIAEYDVVLMLNRNTDSTADIPNNLEKGFHVSENKVYQIPTSYNGRLNLISTHNFAGDIVGITDTFLITNDSGTYNIYQYKNLIGSIFNGIIYHSRNDFPTLKLKFNSDNITISPQQFIQIIGPYTADGSTTANQVVFEGIAKRPTKGRFQYVLIENQGSEMNHVQPNGMKSGRTDEIITDINNDGAPHGPEYIKDGTLSALNIIVKL